MLASPALSEAAHGFSLDRLISVFLSPDVGLDLSAAEIEERDREQRLDGVLRFGDEIVVIESKIVRSSLAKMLVLCLPTAFSEMNRRWAMALLDRPSAISARTSRSRPDSRVTGSSRCRWS